MKEIEDLIKEIANYNKDVFIHKITTHYFDCVKEQIFDKSYYDRFIRCATWLWIKQQFGSVHQTVSF